MPGKKKLSELKTESEEARWFEDNQDQLIKLFEKAASEGSLRVGEKTSALLCRKKPEHCERLRRRR